MDRPAHAGGGAHRPRPPLLGQCRRLPAANQKGAVESLVKFVKGNFLVGRSFYDDADLTQEASAWLHQVNDVRPSDATEQLPSVLLAAERPQFSPLPAVAQDYGFFDTVKVNRESLIAIATNRYSVPAPLVGLVLTARIYPTRIELYHGSELVATHVRQFGRNTRIVIPEHYEAVFAHKPRARVMVYRDWLVALSPTAAAYVSQLCRKRYAEMDAQVLALYQLARQVARDELLAALELALEQQTFGAEYVQALLAAPRRQAPRQVALTDRAMTSLLVPPQRAVERDLALKTRYGASSRPPAFRMPRRWNSSTGACARN